MAWRLRLAPEKTNIDFFRVQWITFGLSAFLVAASFVCFLTLGFNLASTSRVAPPSAPSRPRSWTSGPTVRRSKGWASAT